MTRRSNTWFYSVHGTLYSARGECHCPDKSLPCSARSDRTSRCDALLSGLAKSAARVRSCAEHAPAADAAARPQDRGDFGRQIQQECCLDLTVRRGYAQTVRALPFLLLTYHPRFDTRYNNCYTMAMKTAISLPDPLFEAAEQFAHEQGWSRSELYVRALQAFLQAHRYHGIKDALDQIYSLEQSSLDPALSAAQEHILPRDEW